MNITPHLRFAILPCALFFASFTPWHDARAELLFTDDFSTGDISKHNDFFRWGGNGLIPSPGTGGSRIEQVTGPHGTPVNAMRFRYMALDSDGSSNSKHWAEQRFHLTESIDEERTATGESNVAHQEIWIRYSMFVPQNYFHLLNEQGRPQGQNNKGWLTLWNRNYAASQHPDGEPAPVHNRIEWWPSANNQSYTTAVRRSGGGHAAPIWRHESQGNRAFLPSDYGRWVDFAFGMKLKSFKGADDAFIRAYKNGNLILEWDATQFPEEYDSWARNDDPTMNGFDRGYIMGYHNSGYDETTTFHITNFKIGTTAASVGLGQARPLAPHDVLAD